MPDLRDALDDRRTARAVTVRLVKTDGAVVLKPRIVKRPTPEAQVLCARGPRCPLCPAGEHTPVRIVLAP